MRLVADSSGFAVSRIFQKPLAWLLPASAVFLYLHLFIPPSTPIWTGGDSMIWLHDAARMLDGETLYRDFVQITLPATDLLYFTLFKVFGPRMWIPNAMLLLVGVALVWLSFRIARSINLGRFAVLPPLLFLTLVYKDRLDATHHWYSTLAVMAALATVIDRRSPQRLIIAGVLCGLATTFTQSAGAAALLGFAIFLSWEHRRCLTSQRSLIRQLLILIASFVAAVAVICSYFVWQAGLAKFIYCTLTFNYRYYGSFSVASTWRGYMIGLPAFLHWRQLPGLTGFLLVHALLPLAYVLVLIRYFRQSTEPSEQHWDRVMLITLVGLALLLSVSAAPTWARLYYVSLPALILFPWLLNVEQRTGKILSCGLHVAAILIVILPVAKQVHRPTFLDLPTGRTAFFNQDAYERYGWVASHTRPSEFFFGGFYPDFYFLLGLRNPGPTAYVTSTDYTRPEEVQETLAGLERHHVNIVIWAEDLDLPDKPQGDHLAPLRAYVRDHYRVTERFPEFDAWIRKD
jgi:phage shock protein PspC (stress-responsive transcriptional regulator)